MTAPDALSNAELVEILLRNGCPGSTARELARELLSEYGSLIGLAGLDRAFLHRRGIGEAKAATITAAFEIGRRVARERTPRRDLLDRRLLLDTLHDDRNVPAFMTQRHRLATFSGRSFREKFRSPPIFPDR